MSNTYTAHCLNCNTDYTANAQSASCPHWPLDDPREIERAEVSARRLARKHAKRTAEKDPQCVCLHQLSLHEERDGVLACTVDDCACGPGCIHEGFVDAAGGPVVHNQQAPKP